MEKLEKITLMIFHLLVSSGKIAMKLDPNDKIIGVKTCKKWTRYNFDVPKMANVLDLSQKNWDYLKEDLLRELEALIWLKKIQLYLLSIIDHDLNKKNGKLNKDDQFELKAKEKFILSITENGFGKRTSHYDFRVTNRGGKGIIGIVNSVRNGNVSSSFPVYDGDEILISTNKGRVIRVAVKEIRIAGRKHSRS